MAEWHLPRPQRGAALLIFIVLLVMAALAYLVSNLTPEAIEARRARVTQEALAQAREALIAYALTYRDTRPGEVFGYLPCPDVDGDGSADSPCGGADQVVVGLLPHRQLGLNSYQDATGACFWYVVSGTFKASGEKKDRPPMNWDTQGRLIIQDAAGNTITVPDDGQGGAAAAIIAVGAPLAGQNRASDPCTISAAGTVYAAYLDDGGYSFPGATGANVTLRQGQRGSATNNDQIVWITPKEIWDRIVKRADFGNALTATPPGQINRLADEIRAVIEKQMQDDLVAGGTPSGVSLPANMASYTQFAGKYVGDLLASLSPYDAAYADYFTNWRKQFRQITCSSLDTACVEVNATPPGTPNCRGVLMFGGRTADGRPRTAAQNPEVPSAATLQYYFESGSGLEILNSDTMSFSGSTAYASASPGLDVGICLFKGAFISFARDIAAFAAGQALSAGGVSPAASVTTTPGSEAINLGNSSLYARSGCVWHSTPIPLNSSLRLYFTYRIESAAATAPGFALAIADAATNSINAPGRPILCGAPNASQLGYAGAPASGSVILPSGTILPIAEASWSSPSATITTASDHGLSAGAQVTIAGVLPAGYNGDFFVTGVSPPIQFSYALATDPGQATAGIRPPKIGIEFDTNYDLARADPVGGEEHFAFLYWGDASDNNPAGTGPGNDDNTHGKGVSGDGSQPLNPNASPGSAVVSSSDVYLPYNGAMPLSTDIHVRLDLTRSYNPGQATVSMKAYVGDSFVSVDVSSANWASDSNYATITTASDHGLSSGDYVTITGISPVGYNGTYQVTKETSKRFKYSLTTNPGVYVLGGAVETCGPHYLQNLARDLAALCPRRPAHISQDNIVINDVSGPALANIYVGFTNARGAVASDNQAILITKLMMRSQ